MKPESAVRFDRTFGRFFYPVHRLLLRLTGGAVGGKYDGKPMLLLTTTGRKSGQPREHPLLCKAQPDGTYLVVASNGGRPEPPAWLLNVEADPNVTVRVKRRTFAAVATVLRGEAREAIWPELTAYYDGWQHYTTLTDREIYPVLLRPKA